MTATLKGFLKKFDQLNEREKIQAGQEIVRRLGNLDYAPLTDEELVQIAEEAFLRLDEEEQAHDRPKARRGLAR